MVIVMKPEASSRDIQHVIQRAESVGLKAVLLNGTSRNVVAAIGDRRDLAQDVCAASPGVERVVPILAPYKLASRELKATSTEVCIAHATLGGTKVGTIAGPCTVESRDQIIHTAHRVKQAGAVALRGGAFKPRTSPYSFQGLTRQALEYLAEAREETGLGIVTEIVSPEHVELVGQYADVYQIGARNMQNFALLSAVGETTKPVLLKRGLAATLDEFLLAAEYVLARGNANVILCERGIRTFERETRFTLSLSVVPILKELTHLPVIVDPSHGTGRAGLVRAMCRGAIAVGADGLLVEVHPHPEAARIDGAQSVTPDQFDDLMSDVRRIAEALGRAA